MFKEGKMLQRSYTKGLVGVRVMRSNLPDLTGESDLLLEKSVVGETGQDVDNWRWSSF